jgi:LCP family protein required for cell wall assembly
LRALFGRVGLAIVLCAAVVVASVIALNRYIDQRVDEIPRVALDTSPTTPGHGVNFLIVGSDSRKFVSDQSEYNAFSDADTQSAPPRSDTMMVLHADGDNSYAVSFPRDLWVDIPGHGSAKLNSAFNNGPQPVIDTLQSDFNVPINHYLEVDFKSFEGIVNAIGRINIWVPGVERDIYTGFAAPWGAGCYALDGFDALSYVRARHLEILGPKGWTLVDATADIGRIQRQQDFVRKLGSLAVDKVLDDPFVAPDIVDALLPNLHADANFDRTAMNALVRAFMGLATNGNGLTFETLPWDGPATRDSQSVVLVKYPDADDVFARLRGDAAPPPPTTTAAPSAAPAKVRPGDVSVQVLNASGVNGAAGKAGQDLSNRGFVSGGVGNNPGGVVAATQIRYRTGDEAKAQLVASSVPGATLAPDPSLTSGSVVLVIGSNFKGVGTVAPKDTAAPPPDPEAAEAAC